MDHSCDCSLALKGLILKIPNLVKRASRLFWVFLLGTGLANFITFLALPVYTRLVAPKAYGYYDLSQTIVTIVAALVYADAWVGVMRFSLEDSSQSGSFLRIGLCFFGGSSALLLLIAVAVWVYADPPYVWLTAAVGIGRSMANFWSFSSRGLGGTRAFALSGVLNAAVSFGSTVALLTIFNVGVSALYLGVFLGSLVQVTFLEFRFHLITRAVRAKSDRSMLNRLGRFVLPLSLNSLSFWVFTGFGRVVVSSELGLAANGVFAAVSKLTGIVTVLANILTLVWQQLAFERERKDTEFFEKSSDASALVYSVGSILAAPIGIFLYQILVNQRYSQGWGVVPLAMLVAGMSGYSLFIGNIFYVTERTFGLFGSAISCAVVVLATTIPLVRSMGINGASLALALGYIVNIFVKQFILRRGDSIAAPMSTLVLGSITMSLAVVSAVYFPIALSLSISIVLSSALLLWFWYSRVYKGNYLERDQ